MTRYFENPMTLEELRRQYKDLLKRYHPDNDGGSTEDTQEINAQYNALFKKLKDRHEKESADNAENNKSTYDSQKWDFAEDEKLRDVLQRIISFSGINIEIVGCWIWVDGDTKPYREAFKSLGFRWASEKRKWYFHTEAFRKKSHKKLSMDDIRNYYGCTKMQPEQRELLKQA